MGIAASSAFLWFEWLDEFFHDSRTRFFHLHCFTFVLKTISQRHIVFFQMAIKGDSFDRNFVLIVFFFFFFFISSLRHFCAASIRLNLYFLCVQKQNEKRSRKENGTQRRRWVIFIYSFLYIFLIINIDGCWPSSSCVSSMSLVPSRSHLFRA